MFLGDGSNKAKLSAANDIVSPGLFLSDFILSIFDVLMDGSLLAD